MKTVCIGGGPAGLYLGILQKLADPRHQVVVCERNRPDDTFGFGVVFSEATLGHFAAADPVTHAAITRGFARWDDIETHVGGQVFTSTGHGFCGLERQQLLLILQDRARALGVELRFEHTVRALDEVGDADVVVASDGVASWVRDARAADFRPDVDVRPNKFVWLGTTVPYTAFTFIFAPSRFGLFRVHAYRYSAAGSTFIVECTPATWHAAGLDQTDEDGTIAILEEVFAEHLRGADGRRHRLIKNRSIWRSFPTVRNRSWRSGNVVLVGDAAHTAHFSIGSGTKLAMEDAIALSDALAGAARTAEDAGRAVDVDAALAAYEARRRPEVEALQAAAQSSLEWFEGTERYLGLPPAQLCYSLMTRSLRVSHASMQKRDPALAGAVEALLVAATGAAPGTPPRATPIALLGVTLPGRILTALPDGWPEPLHVVRDDDDAAVAARVAAQLGRRAAATVVVVAAGGDGRSPVPLADRLRNELGVATVVALAAPTAAEVDALIAAGRCDAVLVQQAP